MLQCVIVKNNISHNALSTSEPALLTVEQAANQLGISKHTVRLWIRQRKLGHVRVGVKAIRVPFESVADVIARGYAPATK
jgi:excisionase family DNA binding protein